MLLSHELSICVSPSELYACASLARAVLYEAMLILVWFGSLAAVSMCVGRPTLFGSCLYVGVGNGGLPLFLTPINSKPSTRRVACVAQALRRRAIAAKSSALFVPIPSMYFWKVRHAPFYYARCSLPQFTHDTRSFRHSLVW